MNAKSEAVLFPDTKSEVESVRVLFACGKCNRKWAIYLEPSTAGRGLFKLPAGADTCIACEQRENQEFKALMHNLGR